MNIILVGFMASGKSSLGKTLAKELGYTFIDTDSLIEKKSGMKIKEIFEKFGEMKFRDLETEVCQSLKNLQKHVVSTGGGIVLRSENRTALKTAGKVFYLKITPDDAVSRIKDYTTRPLINYPDPEKRRSIIQDLLSKREPMYQETADHVIISLTGDMPKNIQQVKGLL